MDGEKTAASGAWVVVTTRGGLRYIGFCNPDLFMPDLYVEEPVSVRVRLSLDFNRQWLVLKPAYELYIHMKKEGVEYRRDPIITHPDFIVRNENVGLHVQVDTIYFFEDLHPEDRAFYEKLVLQVQKALGRMREKMRVEAELKGG